MTAEENLGIKPLLHIAKRLAGFKAATFRRIEHSRAILPLHEQNVRLIDKIDAFLMAEHNSAACSLSCAKRRYSRRRHRLLLRPADAARLIEAAGPAADAEITLEANPETVTEELLREFRAAGVNRLSLGVQSARDAQLRTLGRPHTARQARQAFAAARAAGFENITGDIMLALPHYSREEFD